MNTLNRAWLGMGLVLVAGVAGAQAGKGPTQVVKPPVSQAWIDVATFSGFGMPGMGGGPGAGPMSMMGGMAPGKAPANAAARQQMMEKRMDMMQSMMQMMMDRMPPAADRMARADPLMLITGSPAWTWVPSGLMTVSAMFGSSRRNASAKEASFGAELRNSVTAVGEPW